MIGKIDLNEGNNKEYASRIATRLMDQGQDEIIHVLSKLFPHSKVMRIRSTATDFAAKRENSEIEFFGLFESDEVDNDVFINLSSANKDPQIVSLIRSSYEPTKFELSLTCTRTPFKEFFEECSEEICEQCIERRVASFTTENSFSKAPFIAKVERVEKRRLDICKGCGNMIGPKDEMNLQNERLLYKCSYCGHKGWVKAK